MTLNEFLIQVKENFPNATNELILAVINDLEEKLTTELLVPSGLSGRSEPLKTTDTDAILLLSNDDSFIYEAYVLSILALNEKDFSLYDAYSTIFNCRYEGLGVKLRRQNTPKKSTRITGGMFI